MSVVPVATTTAVVSKMPPYQVHYGLILLNLSDRTGTNQDLWLFPASESYLL